MAVVFLPATCRADGPIHECRVLEDYLMPNPAHLFEFKCKRGGQDRLDEVGILDQFILSKDDVRWTATNRLSVNQPISVTSVEKEKFMQQFSELQKLDSHEERKAKGEQFDTAIWSAVKKKLSDCIYIIPQDPDEDCNILQIEFVEKAKKDGNGNKKGDGEELAQRRLQDTFWGEMTIWTLAGSDTKPVVRSLVWGAGMTRSFQRRRNSAITLEVTKRCKYASMSLGMMNLALFLGTGIVMWITKTWLDIRCGMMDTHRTQWEVRDSIESHDDFVAGKTFDADAAPPIRNFVSRMISCKSYEMEPEDLLPDILPEMESNKSVSAGSPMAATLSTGSSRPSSAPSSRPSSRISSKPSRTTTRAKLKRENSSPFHWGTVYDPVEEVEEVHRASSVEEVDETLRASQALEESTGSQASGSQAVGQEAQSPTREEALPETPPAQEQSWKSFMFGSSSPN